MKLLKIFKKLEGPQLVSESKLLTKDKLKIKLNILKTLSDFEFDNITNFLEDEIKPMVS